MTIETAETIQAYAEVASACGIVIVMIQAWVVIKQFRDQRRWNKLHMAFEVLPPSHQLNELELELNNSVLRIIDRNEPLSSSELDTLFKAEHSDLRIKLKNYLNLLEGYCAAVNWEIADADLADAIYGHKFARHFIEMKPYIDRMRASGSDDYMVELEKVIEKWKPKTRKESKY